MQPMPLFYKNIAPLTSARHSSYSIDAVEGFEYARETNSVYISAGEFGRAAKYYPIVFAGDGDDVFPVVLLGYKEKENLFLKEDGGWDADYIPSYVRRYPFVPANTGKQGEYLVCLDEGYPGHL